MKKTLDSKIEAEVARSVYRTFDQLRCHPTERLMLELGLGPRPLTYDWATHTLGPVSYLFVDEHGATYPPTFDKVFVEGKELVGTKIPAGAKLTLTLALAWCRKRTRWSGERALSRSIFASNDEHVDRPVNGAQRQRPQRPYDPKESHA